MVTLEYWVNVANFSVGFVVDSVFCLTAVIATAAAVVMFAAVAVVFAFAIVVCTVVVDVVILVGSGKIIRLQFT